MKNCLIKGCKEKYYAKGHCRNHYRVLVNNEGSKYFQSHKDDKEFLLKRKASRDKHYQKIKDTKEYKERNSEKHRKQYLKDKERIKKKTKVWANRNRFGGLRESVILRDKEQCVECGMIRKEHFKKWHKDLTIDHINRLGRGVDFKERDNRMENLQTLCMRCHGKKDGKINLGIL